MADIENLKRLAEAATPGPWKIHDPIEHAPGANFGVDNAKSEVVVWWGSGYNGIPVTADAEFIAAANPAAILALIAENERLRAERSAMASALMRIVDLSNSGHGPMRSYRQMLDIAAEARCVLGLEAGGHSAENQAETRANAGSELAGKGGRADGQ